MCIFYGSYHKVSSLHHDLTPVLQLLPLAEHPLIGCSPKRRAYDANYCYNPVQPLIISNGHILGMSKVGIQTPYIASKCLIGPFESRGLT